MYWTVSRIHWECTLCTGQWVVFIGSSYKVLKHCVIVLTVNSTVIIICKVHNKRETQIMTHYHTVSIVLEFIIVI